MVVRRQSAGGTRRVRYVGRMPPQVSGATSMIRFAALLMAAMTPGIAMAADAVVSSYWGGPKHDELRAVAILPNGLVAAGGLSGATVSDDKNKKVEGGEGRITLFSAEGKYISDVPCEIVPSDMDCDAKGRLLVVGRGGVLCWDAAAKSKQWQANVGGDDARICAGPGGGAVVLANKQVSLFDAAGNLTGQFHPAGGFVADVACDPASQTIFVVGFDNKRGTPPGQKRYPVQVAFVRAYDLRGEQRWQAYAWDGQEVADRHLMADTRAYRVVLGDDGKLYVAGESAGGNTMWLRSSRNLDETLPMPKFDAFQHAYNTAANHITAVVRIDPKTGASEAATLLLARLGNGKGNTIRPRAIAADSRGNVFVGGASAFSPPKTPGSFGREGGGAFLVIFDSQFRRSFATTLAGSATLQALAHRSGVLAAVGQVEGNELTTAKPAKPEGDDQGDGFLTILRVP